MDWDWLWLVVAFMLGAPWVAVGLGIAAYRGIRWLLGHREPPEWQDMRHIRRR